jgi:hypothetical protein
MKLKFIFFLLFFSFFLRSQQFQNIHQSLRWNLNDKKEQSDASSHSPDFENSVKSHQLKNLPVFKKELILPSNGSINAQLIIKSTSIFSPVQQIEFMHGLQSEFKISTEVLNERGIYKGIIELIPLRVSMQDKLELLQEFEINFQFSPAPTTPAGPDFTYVSVLSSGELHKISVKQRGVYKMDKSFLEKNLKISLQNIDPRNIHVFGNGGRPLPEANNDFFQDDLVENAIYIKGEQDGKFDEGDFILFYATGPDAFHYDPIIQNYVYTKNPYSDESYYFIKIDNTRGKRIELKTSEPNPDYQSSVSFDFKNSQKDLVNLLEIDANNSGSGKVWYGQELSNTRELDFGTEFIFDHIDLSKNGKFSFGFAGRAPINHQVIAIVEGKQSSATVPYAILNSNYPYPFANHVVRSDEFKPVSDLVKAKITYPSLGGTVSEGWLDYFQVSVWKKNIWNNKSLYIMDPDASKSAVTEYNISNVNNDKWIWDITDPLNISQIVSSRNGNQQVFSTQSVNQYRQFLALDESLVFEIPVYVGQISNQNLHGLKDEDMVIIYHKNFQSEAERLKNHRSSWNQLKIALVEQDQVFNEFSSGSQDPTAIRNMMRMLYMRNPNFKYLLLFGDGSFDFKYINKRYTNQNFITTYETDESLDPINAFPTDDYYGLLDPGEGKNLFGLLDISIGRLCARTPAEAKVLVDKIIRYDVDPLNMEDWKLSIAFSADDEDGNVHLIQADRIAESIKSKYPLYNQEKIYLDAYEQVTTPGGQRYPEVNKAFANTFFQGALVINYMGHGGYSGLAQERVLQNTDIRLLENYYRQPLVIVASCDINGFDDPSKTPGGKEGLLNPRGGFLALFSTVRAVFSSDNFDLTNSVYKYLFEFENGAPLAMGEMMRRAKNENSNSGSRFNSRKFLLFGDPSQPLAIPRYKNSVVSINDKIITALADTFKALETVKVKGFVHNQQGEKQTDFSGKLYATVYDKEIKLRTKANDPSSYVREFSLQRNIIYKGSVEVKNGDWEFSFIIPKDINYDFGKGKMSLYATDEKSRDAAGYENGFIIGGVSSDSIKDDKPPVVKVFMNDANFVSGGICDPNPKLYAQISDDFGINISGNSIGHDLTAIIDNNGQTPIILNQVYKSKLNNPKEGELSYPLKNLSPGKHTITVTAWDISNNSGEGTVEFFVVDPDIFTIDRVLNYPNPFSRHTEFQFECNLGIAEMDVVIRIQSISGKTVKIIQKNIQSTGYRIAGIEWDGKDDFGNDLANGVYLYRLSVNAKIGNQNLHKTSDYQKLVILK